MVKYINITVTDNEAFIVQSTKSVVKEDFTENVDENLAFTKVSQVVKYVREFLANPEVEGEVVNNE
jgi:hypothetical protein